MITVEIKTDAVKRALEAYAQKLHAVAQDCLVAATDAAEASARATIRATTTRRTGSLEESWAASWRAPFKRGLFNFSDHADFIENGTRPHVIEARRVRYLRFIVNGELLFRRRVNHPGTKARPFTALASAAGQMAMKASADAGVSRLAREF